MYTTAMPKATKTATSKEKVELKLNLAKMLTSLTDKNSSQSPFTVTPEKFPGDLKENRNWLEA